MAKKKELYLITKLREYAVIHTAAELARIFDCSLDSIKQITLHFGINIKHNSNRREREEYVKQMMFSKTQIEIAQDLGISKQRVNAIINKILGKGGFVA
jgi:hypothetical protein